MDIQFTFLSEYEKKLYSTAWMNYFFNIAKVVATKSKDPNTQVGALLVDSESRRIIGTGYNGFPANVLETFERWERPTKYSFVCHAEMNVIAAAAKFGIKTDGCDLYVTLHPCCDCAKLVASAGIKRIFYIDDGSDQNKSDDWRKLLNYAKTIFAESHINLIPVKEVKDEQSSISDIQLDHTSPAKEEIRWTGCVNDTIDLNNIKDKEIGDLRFVKSRNTLYQWNGIIWVVISEFGKFGKI